MNLTHPDLTGSSGEMMLSASDNLLLTTGTLGRQAEFDRRRKKKWVMLIMVTLNMDMMRVVVMMMGVL